MEIELKEYLEHVWEKYPCICPCHLVQWSATGVRLRKNEAYWKRLGILWYKFGTLTFPRLGLKKRPRPFI